jgi:hypothetical protein
MLVATSLDSLRVCGQGGADTADHRIDCHSFATRVTLYPSSGKFLEAIPSRLTPFVSTTVIARHGRAAAPIASASQDTSAEKPQW